MLSDGRLLITGAGPPRPMPARAPNLGRARCAPRSRRRRRLGWAIAPVETDGRVRLFDGLDAQGRAQAQDQFYDPARGAAARRTRRWPRPRSRLSGSSPRNGQTDVATDARLSLRFSEPLRAGELNAASVTLLGPGGYAAVQVTPAEAGRLLFVTPRQRLQANTDYSLLIDGAHARNGEPLAPTVVDFATGAARADAASGDAAAGKNQPQRDKQTAQAKPVRATAAIPAAAAPAATSRVQRRAQPRPPNPDVTARAAITAADVVVDGASVSMQTDTADEAVDFGFDIAQAGDYGLGLSAFATPGAIAAATLTVQGAAGTVVTWPARPPTTAAAPICPRSRPDATPRGCNRPPARRCASPRPSVATCPPACSRATAVPSPSTAAAATPRWTSPSPTPAICRSARRAPSRPRARCATRCTRTTARCCRASPSPARTK
ncbi:hypothetical protein FE772_16215 [Lysobacter enzymogenes]|nr:Ig-like domain-containing protein [Lysobacter enzymogenes]QCW26951.1 hypothetical protein FE772_16215 [Lysobacter enzymogenes]